MHPTATIQHGQLTTSGIADAFADCAAAAEDRTLRVWNQVEQHLLRFRAGSVQLYTPGRTSKRLGDRLLYRGWLADHQLQLALRRQEQDYQPLGTILIHEQFVTAAQIAEVVGYQCSEELYALFTWQRGEFEISTGDDLDEQLVERIELLPFFDCQEIMAEVARRASDWQAAFEKLYSVDEIFIAVENNDRAASMSDKHLRVHKALDGKRTVRQLPDATMLSPFDCARTLRDLQDWGIAELATDSLTMQTAEECLDRGETENAIVILQSILGRQDVKHETLVQVAELVQRCGSSKLAGEITLAAARACDNPQQALEMARQACECTRGTQALQFLRSLLSDRPAPRPGQQTEYETVSRRLIESLLRDGQAQSALEILEELEGRAEGDSVDLLNLRVHVVHKLGRKRESVDALLRLAEVFEQSGDQEKLARVVEQVLRIDPDQRQAAKAMARLRPGAVKRGVNSVRAAMTAPWRRLGHRKRH